MLGLFVFFYVCLHLLAYAWFDMGFVWADVVAVEGDPLKDVAPEYALGDRLDQRDVLRAEHRAALKRSGEHGHHARRQRRH